MKPGILSLALVLTVIIALAGCKGPVKKEQQPRVLATVNGVAITSDDISLRLGGHSEYIPSSLKDQTLDDIITEELFYQKGVKLGLDKDERFQSSVRLLEKKVDLYKRAEMTRRMRDAQIAAKVNVTEQDIKDYYAKHQDEIVADLRLGVLQFDDEALAKDALAGIRSGTPFDTVAAGKFPHGKKGERPWDMGYLHWNQIQPEMSGAVYGLKKGAVSGVLSGKSGIFIVQLVDRKKSLNASFETQKAVIENRLYGIKIKEAYDRYVQELKKASSIKKYAQ